MDAINDLLLHAVDSPWLLPVMFAVAILDGVFPPVPSETVLVAAAAVAGSSGSVDLVLVCLVAAVGAAVGDNLAFAIGRAAGTTRFRWMRRERVKASFAWASRTLERRGAALILGARYIPVGRVAVNMTAGAVGYPWRRFLPLSLAGGGMWAVYSAAIGFLAGRWFEDAPLLGSAVGIAIALLIGLAVDRVAATRRRAPHAAAATDGRFMRRPTRRDAWPSRNRAAPATERRREAAGRRRA